MKGVVYRHNPHTFVELKEAIANFIWNIPPIVLLHAFANMIRLVDVCLPARGAVSNISCSMRNVFVFSCVSD